MAGRVFKYSFPDGGRNPNKVPWTPSSVRTKTGVQVPRRAGTQFSDGEGQRGTRGKASALRPNTG